MTPAANAIATRRLPRSPTLRLASLSAARRSGLQGALALAASLGFDRVELDDAALPSDHEALDELARLLHGLGLRASAISLPWNPGFESDPIAACRRAERLGCHRLALALDATVALPVTAELGRRIDAVGYRLAGRSASLLVRAEGDDPGARRALLAAVLRELSQVAVGLELEAGDQDLRERWRGRVAAIAIGDRMLLEDPPVRRHQSSPAGTRSLTAPALAGAWGSPPELIVRHQPAELDESDTLARALRRWRQATDEHDGPFEPGLVEDRGEDREQLSPPSWSNVEKNVEQPLPMPPP